MKTVRLGNIANVDLSNVDKKSKDNEQSVKLCNFVDVYYNWAITSKLEPNLMVATANNNQIERFKIKKGQVAITKDSETRDDIGVSTYIADNISDCVLGYHCALITPVETELDGAYLNALFRTRYAIKYFGDKASGSGQRYTLTKEIIEDFPVIMPDTLEEQKNLAKVLTNIDRKITLNNSICADLEAMAKQIYDYWFIQFDFPDENGKPYKSGGGKMVWNEELNREIPDGWEITDIGNITNCYDAKRIPLSAKEREAIKGNIPYYGATGIMGYVNRPIFSGDYVLVAEDGSVMDAKGHPIIQRVSGEIWVNNHAHILEPIAGYSCRLLMFILGEIPVVRIKTGSIQMKINQENLNAYKVVKIPNSLLERVNKTLNVLDNRIIRIYEENRQLTELRDFLLPMLMNGQIKIGA